MPWAVVIFSSDASASTRSVKWSTSLITTLCKTELGPLSGCTGRWAGRSSILRHLGLRLLRGKVVRKRAGITMRVFSFVTSLKRFIFSSPALHVRLVPPHTPVQSPHGPRPPHQVFSLVLLCPRHLEIRPPSFITPEHPVCHPTNPIGLAARLQTLPLLPYLLLLLLPYPLLIV